jgi:hypothetical protein
MHDYHGRDDEAGIWVEVAKRFIPDAYREGCQRIAPWFAGKTADRLALDTDVKLSKSRVALVQPIPTLPTASKSGKSWFRASSPSFVSYGD